MRVLGLVLLMGVVVAAPVPVKKERPAKYVQTWKDKTIAWTPEANDFRDPPEHVRRALVKQFRLRAGDVVGFQDDRGAMHYFLHPTKKAKVFEWKGSIDSAGYLKIPLEMTGRSKDALTRYAAVLKGRNIVALDLPTDDAFVKKWLRDVPKTWKIAVRTYEGKLEELSVKRPGKDWESYDCMGDDPKDVREDLGLER